MPLQPQPIGRVPEETARVARAALPKGNVYIRLRDALGSLYEDASLAPLFHSRGQPAKTPWRLTLGFQFAENMPDRQAAEAVRGRIDWTYALGLGRGQPAGQCDDPLAPRRRISLRGSSARRSGVPPIVVGTTYHTIEHRWRSPSETADISGIPTVRR